jgi:hypothetical protein
MREPFKLPFSHPVVSRIVKQAFPGSKGIRRPIGIECRDKMHIESYWSGGSKYDYGFVRLSDWTTLTANDIPREARQAEGNAYNLPVADIEIQPGFAVVEHIIFCGKDLGYRLYLHGDTIKAILPEAMSLVPLPKLPESDPIPALEGCHTT